MFRRWTYSVGGIIHAHYNEGVKSRQIAIHIYPWLVPYLQLRSVELRHGTLGFLLASPTYGFVRSVKRGRSDIILRGFFTANTMCLLSRFHNEREVVETWNRNVVEKMYMSTDKAADGEQIRCLSLAEIYLLAL